ncbi:MAG: TIM-barrel domain-containing protein [Balneolaceae bacterium]
MDSKRTLNSLAGLLLALSLTSCAALGGLESSGITYNDEPAELSIYQVTDRTVEIRLSPIGDDGEPAEAPSSEVLIDHPRTEIWRGRSVSGTERIQSGAVSVELRGDPLQVTVLNEEGEIVQRFGWSEDSSGEFQFRTDAPVYGMGHGGPQFDRRGHLLPMRDGWGAYERPTHGSRVAAPMLIGLDGWSMFVHHPISQGNVFDLRDGGRFLPDEEMADVPLRLYLTAWDMPEEALSEYRVIAGETPMPPLWSLGYMQSHRTLASRDELLNVAWNFRERNLPVDAVIYLGTGFTPSGWNRGHGNFEFNEDIFDEPEVIFNELKDLNFRVVLHTYNPPVELHGSSVTEESDDPNHIRNYWLDNHDPIARLGVDGWWPDGGEPLSSESRVARFRMYWDGPMLTNPNIRAWNINRTGYSGAHRYGGWLWSGDPESFWETLETHIAVGLNHSVSLTPFWGSDTPGFRPTAELDGELYLRWLQFSAFTASFRGHGRAWHLRLPWAWNSADVGPPETTTTGQWDDVHEAGYPREEWLRNGMVEPIAREYLQLRYRLLPYNYTLMRETHDTGIPPMRPMWLHYPDDPRSAELDDQYLWGRDLLIAPVYEKGASDRTLWLPEGEWYDFWTHEIEEGGREITRQVDLGTLPIYVRAGTLLPLDPVRQYTGQEVDEYPAFRIYSGRDGEYRWYRDDGETQDYQNGEYSWTRLTWDDEARELTIEPDPDSEGQAPEGTMLRLKLVSQGAMVIDEEEEDWQGNRRTELPYRQLIEQLVTIEWDGIRTVVPFRQRD